MEYICDLFDARGGRGEGLRSRGSARGGAADVGVRAEWVVWWVWWRFLLLEGEVRMMEERIGAEDYRKCKVTEAL